MSKIVEKPPPVETGLGMNLDMDIDFESIENYIEKSPITNKFRETNPNLQPTDTETRNTNDDDNGYSSLDPSIVTPPSPPNSSSSISNKKFSTTPLEPEVPENNKEHKNRFKRFSLNRLDLGSSKKSTPSHRKFNSLNTSMNRLSISMSRSNTSLSHLTSENNKNNTRTSPDRSNDTNLLEVSKLSTPYWKYHVLRFGKDLYLTTNPSLKHIYCRNGPGYYVEIISPSKNISLLTKGNQLSFNDGFTMIFKDIESVDNKDKELKPPIMIIHKKSKQEGGYFTVTLSRSSQLKKGLIKYQNGEKNQNQNQNQKSKVFNGLSIPQTIPENYIPYDKVSNVKLLENSEISFKNYELRDFNNLKWNIGSIPRVRYSKLNKFKHKLVNDDQHNRNNEEMVEQLKYIGKKNIYFHQNYIEAGSDTPYRETNPENIYLQSEQKFPPVLGMFRPYEQKASKRIMNSFNKRMSRSFESDYSQSRINHKFVDNDIAGGSDIKNYYKCGDGLYPNNKPHDDVPDENKLGWLTIYEDKDLLQYKGMYDLVIGLTLAIGYESTLNK